MVNPPFLYQRETQKFGLIALKEFPEKKYNKMVVLDTPLLLNINNGVFKKLSHREVVKDGILWLFIEHTLDKNNVPIRGWLVINSESVKSELLGLI